MQKKGADDGAETKLKYCKWRRRGTNRNQGYLAAEQNEEGLCAEESVTTGCEGLRHGGST